MKPFIFWKNRHKETSATTGNPFTSGSAGREEWNDRYFSMKQQIARWQVAFILLSVITMMLAIAAVKHATQSHIQPVVVEVCRGEPKGILPVTAALPDTDRLIKYAISQFIINSRTILSDTDAQKRLLDQTYAYSAQNTLEFLNDYYHKNNPFDLASQMSAQITIIDSMKISPHTWQVTWEENRKNVNGNELLKKSKWVATITTQLGNVNSTFINENPFGIYFTQLSWSEILEQKA